MALSTINKSMAMKHGLLIFFFLLLFFHEGKSQGARFVTEGTIEFEKTINTHSQLRRMLKEQNNNEYFEQYFEHYKKNESQFQVVTSTLSFSKDKALFLPSKVDKTLPNGMTVLPETQQYNIIYSDLAKRNQVVQKSAIDETFLFTTTKPDIKWKITGELREIAGYECRRANAIIMDSIYVVAFYTDQIPVTSGPESFSGLPGMILGVALPHQNITWFAKEVIDKPVSVGTIQPPTKGKAMPYEEMKKKLQPAVQSFGPMGPRALLYYLL